MPLISFRIHQTVVLPLQSPGLEEILKINGGLAAPLNVQRAVRQGCSLSGMLYSLTIELLLHKLRKEPSGVCYPGLSSAVKISAYADDVMVIANEQKYIDIWKQMLVFLTRFPLLR